MADSCDPLKCRLCFEKQFQLLPMFPANEPVNDDLLRKIQECASVSIVYEHDQNSLICIKCIVDVEQFYSFKERCKKNDLFLQQMRHGWEDKLTTDEEELEEGMLPDTEFLEPLTNLISPQLSATSIDSFMGQSKLIRMGYNYRIVRVNEETDVLIYHKHRFYQQTKSSENLQWVCVAKGSLDCPAKLTISSSVQFPLALFTKPIVHNHSDALVQAIGTTDQCDEALVKILPKYTLAHDSHRRLRLLAGGYRYRLKRALAAGGTSLWACVRSECSAQVSLSYENEQALLEVGDSHCHCEEKKSSVSQLENSTLMAEVRAPLVTSEHGYNFYVSAGCMEYRGHFYKRENHTNTMAPIWHCTATNCTASVRVRQKHAKLTNSKHNHPRTKSQSDFTVRILHQGVNYRLLAKPHGNVRLSHRKQTYTFQKAHGHGVTEWSCIWKRLGCKASLKMLRDEQIVYQSLTSSDNVVPHEHRVRNALEQYFLPAALSEPCVETNVWSSPAYDLLWNKSSKPIIRRENDRYYARKAFINGTVEWHCVRGIGTHCEASFTTSKAGDITDESLAHDHQQPRKRKGKQSNLSLGAASNRITSHDIFTSPGPVLLLSGGFNYRRMQNVHLKVEIIVHLSHKYLPDSVEPSAYRCIMRDEPNSCPGKIILTHNALCAELTVAHNHIPRSVPKIVEPDRSSKLIIDGPNYKLIFSMTGRNCLLLHEGHAFRMYKLLASSQSSRWRCIQEKYGCKMYLSVPLTLTQPAVPDDQPHDHSRVRDDTRTVHIKEELLDPEDEQEVWRNRGKESTTQASLRPKRQIKTERESLARADMKVQQLFINPTSSDDQLPSQDGAMMSLHEFTGVRGTMIKREALSNTDTDSMTCFLNGHLYVRQFEGFGELDTLAWICAFHWTLGCVAQLKDTSIHDHERFASVRTNDRFSMLKTLITRGFIGQRGAMMLLPERKRVSEYELLPSNGNLSLIIDENRYYFYKAKNNGEWLWRCVRHRWQGCKIGVAVSHCFGKYYFQPYGKTEHEHS
ncbi:uncharacterized protein LOC128720707 [Anopheles nili]|uniref:uncharacterized protein LOC128720707 n=1 Tax=Anopheles nili TaxID=185578 RepID=UPI00237A5B4A|nr:uncharacterized protein LOC128720707 [Anopheles nili]